MTPEQDNAVHKEEQQEQAMNDDSSSSSLLTTVFKLAAASAFLYSAVSTISSNSPEGGGRRQLSAVGDTLPSYMDPLFKDLRDRKKLFDDTPPEEVKYWFEYAGPLQVSFCVVGDCDQKYIPFHFGTESLTLLDHSFLSYRSRNTFTAFLRPEARPITLKDVMTLA